MADVKQVVGQLSKAFPDEDLVAKQSPKSETTDARQKREHPSNGLPTEDLVDRSIPEPDQEREAMARRRRQLKKERKRERKKEVEHKKELKTLEERVAELRKERENLGTEIEESRQQLKRQKKFTAKKPKALEPELEEAREQPANAEVRHEQAEEEETKLGRRGQVEGPGTKLALEPGLGPKRGPVTRSVGPNGRKNPVLDTCKKKRSPSNVKSTNFDNFQIAINNIKEILLTAMADQDGIDSLPSAAADLIKHVAADFNAADKHDTSATDNSTNNGERTPSQSTGEITFEPGDLHSSKVAESTPNDDGGDAEVTSPTGMARLPKQLRRLQSTLDRLGRNEQERYLDTVLEDYEALRKQHEEFFSGNFNAPRFIGALRQTQTELGPFVCRMSQGYAYLHLWQYGFDLQCDDLITPFRDGSEDIETASKMVAWGVEDIGSTWRPTGRRGQWDFSRDHIFSDLNPGRHVAFKLLHCLWDAVESTEAWLKTIKPLHMDARWKVDPGEQSRPKERSHYPKLGQALDYLQLFQDLSEQFVNVSSKW